MGMLGKWAVPVIGGILILGLFPLNDAFAAVFIDSFDVSGQETLPRSVAFNTDGTKMFVMGVNFDFVNEYACGTGFDLSTCAYSGDGERFSVQTEEISPQSLAFNTDGTKMFVMGSIGDDVNEYACGTGFDVSTCAYSGDGERFDVSGQEGFPQSLAFSTDGTKMFVMGGVGVDVNEYDCTAFDVSTCVYAGDGERFDVSGQDTAPQSLAFNTDGTKMFVLGSQNDFVYEYDCTAFDVSTCAYAGNGERFDVSAQDTSPTSLAFNTDGTKMFVVGVIGGEDVNEYCLGIPFDVSSEPCAIPIGGTLVPIDTTALLLASVQSISMWMIPVVIAGIVIGVLVIKRRK